MWILGTEYVELDKKNINELMDRIENAGPNDLKQIAFTLLTEVALGEARVKALKKEETPVEAPVEVPSDEPEEYQVSVSRIGYGSRTITVMAHTQSEAHELALEEAGDHEYNEHSSEYEVN